MKKQFILLSIIINSIFWYSCKPSDPKFIETVQIDSVLYLPDDLKAKFAETKEQLVSDTLVFGDYYIKVLATILHKDSSSTITKIKILSYTTNQVTASAEISNILNMGTTENPIMMLNGVIHFTNSKPTKLSISGGGFQISSNDGILIRN